MGELKSLNKYLIKYKFRLLWGVVFIALSNWFTIYPAQIFRDAIDMVTENLSIYELFQGSSLVEGIYDNFTSSFLLFAALLIVIALSKSIFTFCMRYTIIMMSRFIEYDLKNEIYQHYQALDVSFYKNNRTGDIMNRIGDDVSKVRMYLGPSIMYIINLIVLFMLIIWTMFSINAKLSVYVLTPLPVMSVIIYFVSIKIGYKSEKVQNQLSSVFSHTQEAFSGIRVIKSYNKTKDIVKGFDEEAQTYMDESMSLVKTESLFHPVILFLPVLSTLLTIYVGGIAVMNKEITFGNIAEFVIYINLLTWPVASLGWVTSLIQRAKASMKRINEFLNTKPTVVNPTSENFDASGDLEMKNVSFTYPESGTKALKNINFKISQGQSLAIVGKTGSGKSTIIQLISRMYDPSSGEVHVGGKNIKTINLDELRRQTGVVPQDTFLFSDTIGNNIAFGTYGQASTKKHQAIVNAAQSASIHQNISSFPDGYDTMVGERGITLSGGQKQRISIARALLKKPEILVLDDSLSAVDTSTEEEILNNLKGLLKGKTSIIISHRISTIKHCDEIIVLDQGEIVERGNHNLLVKKDGQYANFYNEQKLTE